MQLAVLEASAIDAIADLCRRSLTDPPATDELAGALFATDQPAVVQGDPDIGVVATVRDEDRGFVRLLVVDPAHRGRGHGHELLRAAEAELSGVQTVTVGADAPYFLFPGAESRETALLCLLERHHYERIGTNFNMTVDLAKIPEDGGGHQVASPSERDDVSAWLEGNWPDWKAEGLRALDKGTLLLARDDQGIAAFCAYDVNRRGLLGPVASRYDRIGKGAAAPLIVGALHRMRAAGYSQVEVVWVGPVVPYARVGAVVSRVFFVYRRKLS
jgi:GNAT superfamily N-acetyltransferase